MCALGRDLARSDTRVSDEVQVICYCSDKRVFGRKSVLTPVSVLGQELACSETRVSGGVRLSSKYFQLCLTHVQVVCSFFVRSRNEICTEWKVVLDNTAQAMHNSISQLPLQIKILHRMRVSVIARTHARTHTRTHTHTHAHTHTHIRTHLSLIHIWRCRRDVLCRSRWSPDH